MDLTQKHPSEVKPSASNISDLPKRAYHKEENIRMENETDYALLHFIQFYTQEFRPHIEQIVGEILADPKADV